MEFGQNVGLNSSVPLIGARRPLMIMDEIGLW